jgi:hypothetical protein
VPGQLQFWLEMIPEDECDDGNDAYKGSNVMVAAIRGKMAL